VINESKTINACKIFYSVAYIHFLIHRFKCPLLYGSWIISQIQNQVGGGGVTEFLETEGPRLIRLLVAFDFRC
jgi:hypothetical protein